MPFVPRACLERGSDPKFSRSPLFPLLLSRWLWLCCAWRGDEPVRNVPFDQSAKFAVKLGLQTRSTRTFVKRSRGGNDNSHTHPPPICALVGIVKRGPAVEQTLARGLGKH